MTLIQNRLHPIIAPISLFRSLLLSPFDQFSWQHVRTQSWTLILKITRIVSQILRLKLLNIFYIFLSIDAFVRCGLGIWRGENPPKLCSYLGNRVCKLSETVRNDPDVNSCYSPERGVKLMNVIVRMRSSEKAIKQKLLLNLQFDCLMIASDWMS